MLHLFRLGALLIISSFFILFDRNAIACDNSLKDNGGVGLMFHYLPSEDFQNKINSFDVDRFVRDVESAGVAYIVFPFGQNSGYMNAPNETYDQIVGGGPGLYTAQRDIVGEIARGLRRSRVRVVFYLPLRAPQFNKKISSAFGDVGEYDPVPIDFSKKWAAVIREYSLRYGCDVAGWWFDGAYNLKEFNRFGGSLDYVGAAQAGNPNSLVAFNPGANSKAFDAVAFGQNMTAGEQNNLKIPHIHNDSNLKLHVMTYLSSGWGKSDEIQLTTAEVKEFIEFFKLKNGLVTFDVGIDISDGHINRSHLKFVGGLIK